MNRPMVGNKDDKWRARDLKKCSTCLQQEWVQKEFIS